MIAEVGNVETTRAWDVDGDDDLEIVPNTPGGPLVIYKLIRDVAGKGTGEFTTRTIWSKPPGHGLGFGDITGFGRGDFVLNNGWLEAPSKGGCGDWVHHADFNLGSANIPILVVDVNGDGLSDLIVGQGHNYDSGLVGAGPRCRRKPDLEAPPDRPLQRAVPRSAVGRYRWRRQVRTDHRKTASRS